MQTEIEPQPDPPSTLEHTLNVVPNVYPGVKADEVVKRKVTAKVTDALVSHALPSTSQPEERGAS